MDKQLFNKIIDLSGVLKEETYYNTHGKPSTFKDFVETEVIERGNYSIDEINEWAKKYGLSDNDLCLWVTKTPQDTLHYLEEYNEETGEYEAPELEEVELSEISSDKGIIIPESDDGDGGFLFVYRKK